MEVWEAAMKGLMALDGLSRAIELGAKTLKHYNTVPVHALFHAGCYPSGSAAPPSHQGAVS